MGLLWGRLALSSFHIILLPWLVAYRSCVGVRGGTSFTTAKWNTGEHERSCSLSLYKTLSLSAVYDFREAPHKRLYIIFLCLHEDDFSFACQVATGLFFYKSTVLSKHPLHILMCVQWQYAFIKEKINTLLAAVAIWWAAIDYIIHIWIFQNGKFEQGDKL